jgi:hypothetical protein
MGKEREVRAEDVRRLMVETAKVQIASLGAGIAFWTGWVERTSAFAKAANKELLGLSEGKADANQAINRLVDSTREYLRSVTELPALAASEFTSELGKPGSAKNSRRRSARVKP